MKQSLQCCDNNSNWIILYITNEQYLVCDECLQIPYWSRGIKEKIQISEIDGQGRPHSISEQELIDSG